MSQVESLRGNINEINRYSFQQIMLVFAIVLIPILLGAYIIYLLYTSIKLYIVVNRDISKDQETNVVSPLMVKDNDDEKYKDPTLEQDKADYDLYNSSTIANNISNTLADPETQTYNDAQKAIWKVIYDKDPIDIIDRNALLIENDNW